ncbi:MAG: hypothetical protein KGI08_05175 [Thaumarchaeota archaeon]|nr:hypothetical protein [Nitrososphaerota archaeon]
MDANNDEISPAEDEGALAPEEGSAEILPGEDEEFQENEEDEKRLASTEKQEPEWKVAIRAAEDRAARAEAAIARLQERQIPPQQAENNFGVEPEDRFNARLQTMTLEERMEAKFDRAQQIHKIELGKMQFQAADGADRAAFQAKALTDPNRAKYMQQVEDTLAYERKNRTPFAAADREAIYYYLRGKAAEANSGKVNKVKQQAKERVQNQQARTLPGNSDQVPERRGGKVGDNSIAALEKRLAGVYI